ncbi:hypothetical protein CPC08DRAFT_338128 [Agrocybe pediades]|nr:hypothetical protein CPC08DRAFT_338128 [Agrocybe pediades]
MLGLEFSALGTAFGLCPSKSSLSHRQERHCSKKSNRGSSGSHRLRLLAPGVSLAHSTSSRISKHPYSDLFMGWPPVCYSDFMSTDAGGATSGGEGGVVKTRYGDERRCRVGFSKFHDGVYAYCIMRSGQSLLANALVYLRPL